MLIKKRYFSAIMIATNTAIIPITKKHKQKTEPKLRFEINTMNKSVTSYYLALST